MMSATRASSFRNYCLGGRGGYIFMWQELHCKVFVGEAHFIMKLHFGGEFESSGGEAESFGGGSFPHYSVISTS